MKTKTTIYSYQNLPNQLMIRIKTVIAGSILLLTFMLNGSFVFASESIARHHLQIELFPERQSLQAIDELTIINPGSDEFIFILSPRADQIQVTVNGKPHPFAFKNGELKIVKAVRPVDREIQITIRYTAIFDDPVPTRPVNADNPGYGVSASITERGSFFLAGSGWYPQWVAGHSIYTLEVTAPEGLIAVTAGESRGHITQKGKTKSTWFIKDTGRGLSLSVGVYIVREKKVGRITAATYFSAETDPMADAYLNATVKYLSLYQDLFGPYPFQKFAVVENFFPTGFGFPSYTLIGGTVLRLPFIIRTSLGHEIAHCWWGNGVLVDYETGNWSEGLTTYLADYLYKEMASNDEARGYRLQILRNYSTLIKPDEEFALKAFQSRYNPVTKTIGYDKCAMVFHMLRKKLGEEAFWGTLRDLYRDRLFKVTSWFDIQKAFEARGQQPLNVFFDQWVFQRGIPQFYLDAVRSKRTDGNWIIEGRIVQKAPEFMFDLELVLETHGHTLSKTIRISDKETPFQVVSQSSPIRLVADPENHIMRRLFQVEIPPAINSIKGSSSVLVVLSANLEPKVKSAARTLILSLGIKNYSIVEENEIIRDQLLGKDLLVIGFPHKDMLLRNLPDQIIINPKSFVLDNTSYQKLSDSFFGVFAHPFSVNRVTALFFPLSSQQVDRVSRKITHYGKYSYLAFQNGQNRTKGFWSIGQSPLEHTWNADL